MNLRSEARGLQNALLNLLEDITKLSVMLHLKQKIRGKKTMILYGKSYIKFLLVYACQTYGLTFKEKLEDEQIEENACCVAGELCENAVIENLKKQGCLSLLDLIEG